MAIISNLIARLAVDHSSFDRGMQNSRKSLRGLAEESATANKKLLGMAKSAFELAGIGVSLYAVKQAFVGAVKEAAAFETGMAKVSTQLDASSMSMLPKFRQEIQRMSLAYGEATASLSQGAMDIIGSGIDPSASMKVLEASTIAAKGGFTQTATVVRSVVGVLNAYQMEAEKATYVTDIMHKIVQDGVISFEELAHGFGMVTSLSAQIGVDLEAVGAAIATITRAGVPAEIAITSLRGILNTFMNPTDAARQAAKELGFALDENSIKGTGLLTVIESLKNANAGQLKALMPNVRGLVGFAASMKNAAGMAEILDGMLHANGASLEKWEKVQGTASIAMDRSREAWNNLKVALGDALLPTVTGAMDGFTAAVEKNQSAIQRWAADTREGFGIVGEFMKARWDYFASGGLPGHLYRDYKETHGVNEAQARKRNWEFVAESYSRMPLDARASFEEAFAQRTIQGATGPWTPPKQYEFNPEKMPGVLNYGWDFRTTHREFAAQNDVAYAYRLANAYRRAPDVQAQHRAHAEALRAAETLRRQQEADAMRTRISDVIGGVPGRLGGWLDTAVGSARSWAEAEPTGMKKYLDDLREETKMLGMSEEALRLYEATQKAAGIARKDFAEGLRTTPTLMDEETRAIRDLIAEQERLDQLRAQGEFNEKVGAKIADIQFETKLLGMSNEQRERAILFRQLENEAAQANVELSAAQREELQATLELYERQQKIAEVGSILGTGMVDGLRSMQEALITGGDAWEALGNVALNVLNRIQEALVWKPLEDMATSFGTQFLNNLIGGAVGSAVGGGGGGGTYSGYATTGSSGYTTSGGMSTVTGEVLHGGGLAGSGYSRAVPTGVFARAPRFHLGTDEVPAILQRGERVTSTSGVAAERQAFGQMVALLRQIARKDQRITLNDRRQRTDEYIASREGEKKVMWHVQRNQE